MPSSSNRWIPKESEPSQTSFADVLFPAGACSEAIRANAANREANRGATDEPPRAKCPSVSMRPPSHVEHVEYAPIYQVKLVRIDTISVREKMFSARAVAALAWRMLKDADREQLLALLLDTKGQLIGVTTISTGDLSSALVHPREVFKPAILANAASLIVVHNHPSTDPTPSPEDVALTRRLVEAGEILGIQVLDHVVVGDKQRWVSLQEKGLI